jgi:TRAP-type C4-dicarboxylate transport system permease small subunit
MRAFERLIGLIDWVAKVASMIFVLTVLCVMTGQIFFRYVLNSSLQWSEELSIWAMIWMVFTGSVVVIRHWEHIYIPTLIRALPLVVRPFLIILSKVATIIFFGAILYYGIQIFNGQANAFSHNIGVSTKWAKLSVPVGGGLMILMVVAQILEDLRRLFARDWGYFAEYGRMDVD